MSYNVAVDGPAGAGKSTVVRAAAGRMGLVYVDTGAMYRALTLFLLREKVDLTDFDAVDQASSRADITIRYENGEQVVYLNGENVNAYLRTEEVSNTTSVVSAQPRVREKIVDLQKKLAAQCDCIMEGRDIGTCVLPEADVKIYLTASSLVRAKRRFVELTAKGVVCDLKRIQEDIEERDYRDMHREISPLVRAEDAILLDTSDMSIEQVIEAVIALCGRK